MSIYLPTPPFKTDQKIYSWKEVLGEKSSDIRFGGKYENALEHYCSSSPSERLRPKLGFLWKPIRHYCFSPRWQHTNLNLSYLGAKSFSQDQQIWMLYMRKSFSGDHQIWILYLVTNVILEKIFFRGSTNLNIIFGDKIFFSGWTNRNCGRASKCAIKPVLC